MNRSGTLDEPKQFRAKISLKNNRLISLREKAGMSQSELATAANVPIGAVSAAECLRERFPTRQKLAEYFNVAIDWLFSDELAGIRNTTASVEFSRSERGVEYARREVLRLTSSLDVADPAVVFDPPLADLKETVSFALRTLSSREREIVSFYFGFDGADPATLAAVGNKFHVSRERIRQVIGKAIRKLRHPSRGITKAYGIREASDHIYLK